MKAINFLAIFFSFLPGLIKLLVQICKGKNIKYEFDVRIELEDKGIPSKN